MEIKIDKNLHLSIQSQIEGYIEFGIMSGYFRQQPKLPSVRELSRQLNVSQATVSKAYETLKEKSLIYTVPGKGVFVIRGAIESKRINAINELKHDFEVLIEKSRQQNIDPLFFIHLLDTGPKILTLKEKVAWVGNSQRVNQRYIDELMNIVAIQETVDNYSFEQFKQLDISQRLEYGLILTIPHCVPKVENMAPDKEILAPYLIPSPSVIHRLTELKSDVKLLVVSRYPDFIPVMLEGIRRHSSVHSNIVAIDVDDIDDYIKSDDFDVLVYSSGCFEAIENANTISIPTFEYDHVPDRDYLLGIVVPALNKIGN